MAHLPVLRPADLGTQFDWLAAVVGHLEKAGRQPDRENIAADRDIVKYLVEELKLQVRMLRIHRNLEEPLSVRISRSRFRSRLQKRVVNAASGKLSITRRIKAGRNTAKRFIDPGRPALRAAALEPVLENVQRVRLRG